MSSGDRVKLNVGGTVFETTRTTLCGSSAYFSQLLGDNFKDGTQEEVFIDRDPHAFRHVLSLLRAPCEYHYPPCYRSELDYYGIDAEFTEQEPEPECFTEATRPCGEDHVIVGVDPVPNIAGLVFMTSHRGGDEGSSSTWFTNTINKEPFTRRAGPAKQILRPLQPDSVQRIQFKGTRTADGVASICFSCHVYPNIPNAELVHQLISSVVIGWPGAQIVLPGKLMQYKVLVESPPGHLQSQKKETEESGVIYFRIPFSLCEGGRMLPTSAIWENFSLTIDINQRFLETYSIGCPELHLDTVFVSQPDRRMLCKPFFVPVDTYTNVAHVEVKPNQPSAHLDLNWFGTGWKLYFAFETQSFPVQFGRISSIVVQHLAQQVIISETHRSLTERMAYRGYKPPGLVYELNWDGCTINWTRLDVLDVDVYFPDEHPGGTFYIVGVCHRKLRVAGGATAFLSGT
jgi:hypothetical protein